MSMRTSIDPETRLQVEERGGEGTDPVAIAGQAGKRTWSRRKEETSRMWRTPRVL